MTKKKTKAQKDAKQLIRILSKPIKVESKKHGNLVLRPLASGDFEFLSEIVKLNLPPREFTVKVIRRTLVDPKLGERQIKAFSDARLATIATKLIKDKRMNIENIPEGKITFDLFKQKIEDDFNEVCKTIQSSFAERLQWLIDFQEEKAPLIDAAEKKLVSCGYRHSLDILKIDGFRIFANLGPKTLDATITNIWLGLTRRDEFKGELRERFQNSNKLRRRWRIIEHALEAHQRGDYILSIPVLFTQIEGILGDALVLNHKAKSKDEKLFLLDANGSVKIENGKSVELSGISNIIEHPYFKDIARIKNIIKMLGEEKLVQERNAILHGRKTTYGRAKLSTQSILLVYVLIRTAARFEQPIEIPS